MSVVAGSIVIINAVIVVTVSSYSKCTGVDRIVCTDRLAIAVPLDLLFLFVYYDLDVIRIKVPFNNCDLYGLIVAVIVFV